MNKIRIFIGVTFLLLIALIPNLFAVTTDKVSYGTSTAMTITLNSLATSTTACRQSTPIDNTSNLFVDALDTVIIDTSSSAIGSSKTVNVYLYGSEDGTNYDQDDAGIASADGAYTINASTNLRGPVVISTPTASKVYNKVIPSVASFFGGVMPRKWGIVVCNDTNQSLNSGGNSASYTGVYYTNG